MTEASKQASNWIRRMADQDDQQAFKALFEHFYAQLLRFVVYYLHVQETAEEVVQDIFLKVWQHRTRLPDVANFRAYLFTMARNQCLSHLQLKPPPKLVSLDADVALRLASDQFDPVQEYQFQETKARLDQAVDELPPRCRLIFQLVKEQGMSYKEVGELLTISPRTVETQIAIALAKLATTLQASLT